MVAQLLRANNFNLVRIPLAVAAVTNNIEVDRYKMGNETKLLETFQERELLYLDVLDYVVNELEHHNLLVLLDAHVMQPAGSIPPLWYDDEQDCTQDIVEQMWRTLALRYKNKWNVIGADLNNEPHGEATWGSGNVKTDWRLAATRLADQVLTLCPRWLIFVEGVQTTKYNPGHDVPCFWGENLQAAGQLPVELCVDNRLVYSPHTYGPAVANQPYFNAEDFPHNMPCVWDSHFGYLKREARVPLVIGEWGGRFDNRKDWSWQKRFAEYVQHNRIDGVIFWCVNPNGGDTDGLLCADWRTPNDKAFQVLSRFTGTPVPPSC
ncbi:cellulase (glycosyl hydrolase family 5) subfamily protein [Plasmopara halstedii]|uniref:Cellulase (Glycosyl hydrolase family 5) subfamily protein n=1 Tax=Plasmopara halstedii TaxID=4781 RepID=A0A0P1AXQ1_PLAHL|nr:cellulase (glycosyl hydrolase family 5) subfamily protein [Plasmopara halstedii]CEG46837.1 cellulase (glycosyl hydrolase family 5) subfamily protein [Plasmopara halstedii]|eukprot:XP_024583206.1 cellulase (glycosyl hydrolase family 5) subfamily protein [Plasmopara halstedii]